MSIVLDALLRTAVNPALGMLPAAMDTDRARVQMLATTLQEADATRRVQSGNGPAHGLWQMEENGAVRGVMQHPASRDFAHAICATRHLVFDRYAVWQALVHDDILAAAFARLLLWTDVRALPDIDRADDAWQMYLRVWKPGKPRPLDWPANHALARAQVLA